MATELGKAFVQIVPSAKGISGSISNVLGDEADNAGKKAGLSFAGKMGSAIAGATKLVAAGVTAITGTLTAGANSVAAYGDNIDKMSQKMGISAQGYQEWEAVMQHSGTSMETMKSSMKTLANAVEKGNGAFERIGISMGDLSSMSNEEIFSATIAGLQNVDNETERTYLAGQLLGRGATELGALLNTSAEDTQAMRDRVRELGGVMSDDAVKAAAAFQDNMQDLKTAMSGVGRGMMSELMPSMNNIIAGFTSLVIGEEGATEKLKAGFEGLFSSIDGISKRVIEKITTLIPSAVQGLASILPQIISMAGELVSSLATGIIQAIPTLITTVIPSLLNAAVQLIAALGKALIDVAPQLFDAGIQLIDMLLSAFQNADMLSEGTGLVDNLLNGITQKFPDILNRGVEAISNLVNGILKSLPSIVTTAGTIITKLTTTIISLLPSVLSSGTKLVLSLVDGVIRNLPSIVQSVVRVVTTFVATIGQNLPTILAQGITIVGKLVSGLIQAIPQIISAIPQLISAIVNGFGNYDWWSIGKNIVRGIADGLRNAAGMIADAAKDAAKRAFEAAKDFLGIDSPAKKGIYIGEMYDAGIAEGILDNKSLVNNALSDLNRASFSGFKASTNYDFGSPSDNSDRFEELLSLLRAYLPEIADKEGVSVNQLFNGINRQLGWGVK